MSPSAPTIGAAVAAAPAAETKPAPAFPAAATTFVPPSTPILPAIL